MKKPDAWRIYNREFDYWALTDDDAHVTTAKNLGLEIEALYVAPIDEIERLQEALDDLLETCELNGMHGDLTYQQCKAVYVASVTPNVELRGRAL